MLAYYFKPITNATSIVIITGQDQQPRIYYALNKLLLAFCQAYTFSADADSFFYSASLLRSSRNESVPFQLS